MQTDNRYMDLMVRLPKDTRAYPNELRKILAAENDKASERYKLSPEIFHYRQGAGGEIKAKTQFSPFRFGAGAGTFHLYAVGADAVDLLEEQGHRVTRLLGQHYGEPLFEKRYHGIFELQPSNRLRRYFVASLAFQESPEQHQAIAEDARAGRVSAQIEAMIEAQIRKGISRQYAMLGRSLSDRDWLMGNIEVDGINGGSRFVPVEVKPGVYFLSARGVSFRANLNLQKGPWHVGHLASRGMGRVLLAREGSHG